MTAFMRAFLHCDKCGAFFRSDTVPPDLSIGEARKYARRHGWTFPLKSVGRPKRIDVCAECS